MDEEPEDGAMELDDADFLEARIDNISVSNLGFIVFLRPEGDARVLPIFIGANEAHSIAIAFNNQVPPRPLTHDLLKNILGLLDVEVVKIQVTSLSENTFYGRIYLRKEGIEEMDVDARPSDAIALALRYKVPIYVHKDVFESAAIQVKESEGEEGGESGAAEEAGEKPEAHHPVSRMDRLKENLQKALAAEHYEEAAKIRDELKRLQSGN
jgi:bifunctional DNase/RNase